MRPLALALAFALGAARAPAGDLPVLWRRAEAREPGAEVALAREYLARGALEQAVERAERALAADGWDRAAREVLVEAAVRRWSGPAAQARYLARPPARAGADALHLELALAAGDRARAAALAERLAATPGPSPGAVAARSVAARAAHACLPPARARALAAREAVAALAAPEEGRAFDALPLARELARQPASSVGALAGTTAPGPSVAALRGLVAFERGELGAAVRELEGAARASPEPGFRRTVAGLLDRLGLRAAAERVRTGALASSGAPPRADLVRPSTPALAASLEASAAASGRAAPWRAAARLRASQLNPSRALLDYARALAVRPELGGAGPSGLVAEAARFVARSPRAGSFAGAVAELWDGHPASARFLARLDLVQGRPEAALRRLLPSAPAPVTPEDLALRGSALLEAGSPVAGARALAEALEVLGWPEGPDRSAYERLRPLVAARAALPLPPSARPGLAPARARADRLARRAAALAAEGCWRQAALAAAEAARLAPDLSPSGVAAAARFVVAAARPAAGRAPAGPWLPAARALGCGLLEGAPGPKLRRRLEAAVALLDRRLAARAAPGASAVWSARLGAAAGLAASGDAAAAGALARAVARGAPPEDPDDPSGVRRRARSLLLRLGSSL